MYEVSYGDRKRFMFMYEYGCCRGCGRMDQLLVPVYLTQEFRDKIRLPLLKPATADVYCIAGQVIFRRVGYDMSHDVLILPNKNQNLWTPVPDKRQVNSLC